MSYTWSTPDLFPFSQRVKAENIKGKLSEFYIL